MSRENYLLTVLSLHIGETLTPELIERIAKDFRPQRRPRRFISRGRLYELLRYDPESGFFFWAVERKLGGGKHIIPAGARAGTIDTRGYITMMLDGKRYYAHRLAWLYVHGESPHHIDHINCIPGDNRLINLRAATSSQSGANRRKNKNNTTGFRGVWFNKKKGKFAGSLVLNRRRRHLGYFDTPEEAHAAYVKAARDSFGVFARAA